MRFLVVLALVFFCPASAIAEGSAKTVVHDQAEAKALSGQHLFTEWGLSFSEADTPYTRFGSVLITNEHGTYKIHGYHESYIPLYKSPKYTSGGFMKLNGIITSIDKHKFTVEGSIETQQLYGSIYMPAFRCATSSPLVFSRKGHPKYWRINISCSCPDLNGEFNNVDLGFDIFLAPLKKPLVFKNRPSPLSEMKISECRRVPIPYKNN